MLYTGIYHTFEQKDFVAKYSEKKNHWTRQLLTLFSALKTSGFQAAPLPRSSYTDTEITEGERDWD